MITEPLSYEEAIKQHAAKKVAEFIKVVCQAVNLLKFLFYFVMFVAYVSLFVICCNFFSISK